MITNPGLVFEVLPGFARKERKGLHSKLHFWVFLG
jgi:hypothetical protein